MSTSAEKLSFSTSPRPSAVDVYAHAAPKRATSKRSSAPADLSSGVNAIRIGPCAISGMGSEIAAAVRSLRRPPCRPRRGRRAGRGDDVVADVVAELGNVDDAQHRGRSAGSTRSRPSFGVHDRRHASAGHLRRCVDVRDEPDRRHARLGRRRRNVPSRSRARPPPRPSGRAPRAPPRGRAEDELRRRARIGRRGLVRLRVVPDVAQEAIENGDHSGTRSHGIGLSASVAADSRNVRVQRAHGVVDASRGIIHVMRNDDVAMPCGAIPAARSAREPRRTFANVALMPAPTTLTAPRPSTMRSASPNARQRRRGRALRRAGSRARPPASAVAADVQLLAGHAALVEQREHVGAASPADRLPSRAPARRARWRRRRRCPACAAGASGRRCRRPTDRRPATATPVARA